MLKDHYTPFGVANLAMQNNKFLGSVRKTNKRPVGGRQWIQPIQFGLPGGGSSSFATANAATANESLYDSFQVPRTKHYRVARVDNETIEASADGDADAFEPAFNEFDNALEAEGNWLEFRAFRTRGGYIGRMTNSNVGLSVITLDDAAGVFGVRKGDVINLGSTNGLSGAIRAGSLTVASVGRKAGTITTTAPISTGVSAAATNDYIYLAGDFGLAPAGLADWVPDNDTDAATTLYSCDRSVDPELLGGLRVDGTDGQPMHELLINMVTEADNIGADPDRVWMNPRAAGNLTKQLEGKWTITQAADFSGKKMASIGYKGWTVSLEGHEVTIMTNRCCPVKRVFCLDSDTFTMFSAGPAPQFLQKRAGSIIKVSEAADGYEARVGGYLNFACKAPGWNVNGQTA
jgi:hypothetical protein